MGDFSNLKSLYNNILNFAEKNNLSLVGNAYEIGLNEFVITQIDEYVTKVIIKIDK